MARKPVRIHWCAGCELPADLPCMDEGHDTYEAVVTALVPDGQADDVRSWSEVELELAKAENADLVTEIERLRHIIRTRVPFGWVHVGALGYDGDPGA